MSTWSDGYVADTTYTTGFYRELAPSWLSLATLLLGQRPPSIAGHFRWCELGCGQGFSATIFAAAHPEAEFHGIDFNPAHIDNARTLAARAGLSNVTFTEASFEELAAAPQGTWPQMDFIVLHGVWSWVSSVQRAHILRFIARQLAPGGILYVSYNTLPGWASMVPLQRLLRLHLQGRPGTAAEQAREAVAFLRDLAGGDSLFFPQNPVAGARLEQLLAHDPRYIAHEYLNETWDPLMFDAVARDMAEARCTFIGSATLTDNVDAVAVPPKLAAGLAQVANPMLREVLRDIGAARPFRRDLYRRGVDAPVGGEQIALVDQVTLHDIGRAEGEFKISTGIGSVVARPEIYEPVFARLAQGPLTFRELRAMPWMQGKPVADAMQVLAFVTAGGAAHPAARAEPPPAAAAATAALNRAIGLHNSRGGGFSHLASPILGSGIAADAIETAMVADWHDGITADLPALADRLLALLAETGRTPVRDGKPVTDPAQARAAMLDTIDRFATRRLPLLRRLGILPG